MSTDRATRAVADRRWETALDMARLGVWDWNLVAGDCFYSASWKRMLGYEPEELPDDPDLWLSLIHPDDRDHAVESGERHIKGETDAIDTEFRLRHKSGDWRWIIDRGGIIERDAAGTPTRMIGVQTDITNLKNAERELGNLNERFQLALDISGIGIWHFEVASGKVFWDARMREIFGLGPGPEEVPPTTWREHLHQDDAAEIERRTEMQVGVEGTLHLRYRIVRPDGTIRHIESLAQYVVGDGGRLVGAIRDVTEEEARQRDLAYAARHDPLTGVLNRAAFDEEIGPRIAKAAETPFALFYIDLDHFKGLNDFAGHAAGDAALKSVTRNLQAALPPTAIICRLGGDEFAAVAEVRSTKAAERIAAELLEAVRESETGSSNWRHGLAASIGVRYVEDAGVLATDLLAQADDACYAAKSAGRNGYALAQDIDDRIRNLTAVRLVSDIADAMEENRIKLFGQQIRSIESPWTPQRRIEVLARLVDECGNVVSPAHFIPAAERFGMAATLDRWIFRQALTQFEDYLRDDQGMMLGFNLSAQTLSAPDLWKFVQTTMEETGARAENIVFEITETAAVTNFRVAERFVRTVRRAGCRVALDDFGAGLSSFAYLRRFAVDSVKIDGAFVRNVARNRFDRAIVSSVGCIARDLGFDVIAEKIEDPAALPVLGDLNVSFVQGFLLHQPEPLEDIARREWAKISPPSRRKVQQR
ncbi:EAL domain-containing protein [Oricola cellulosilytica]|uniref:EAL domain-containing protein n=1 Tax=Oricola cellulosilytica TaxID=1429082 RepID=A0A4R0PFJ3_9HYPH|nr:EAL domain-containing protein [Oricola cellulosilytica]TCD16607.1 EAL domain-containing protein [Oricola cellulosilytica]